MQLRELTLRFVPRSYLVVRGAMSAQNCAAARDRLWETSASRVLRRDDPSSWVGPIPASDQSREDNNALGDYRWQWRAAGRNRYGVQGVHL